MLPAKRRRLQGKQCPPEGQDSRDSRSQLQTLVRDAWVADKMRAEGSHGHARRNVLRVEFTSIEKTPVLESMLARGQVPGQLMAATRALLFSWQVEAPIVVNEPAARCYRGCGTKTPDAAARAMLAEGESRVADVCRLLQVSPEVQGLWDDFRHFAEQLQQGKLDRVTLACELQTAVSFQSTVPSIHFHLMFDCRSLAGYFSK